MEKPFIDLPKAFLYPRVVFRNLLLQKFIIVFTFHIG